MAEGAVRVLAEAMGVADADDEVELRFGTCPDPHSHSHSQQQPQPQGGFSAHVPRRFFVQLRRALSREGARLARLADVHDVVHVAPHPPAGEALRYVCDAGDARAVRTLNRKRTKHRACAFLPGLPFALRASVASDRDEAPPPHAPLQPPQGCTVRERRRASYAAEGGRFRVDLTAVRTQRPRQAPALEYEAEVELSPALVAACCRDPQRAQAEAAGVVRFVQWLCVAALRMDPHWFGDVLRAPIAPRDAAPLEAAAREALPQGSVRRGSFVGAMPVNFHRRHFAELQKSAPGEFFVSEKTDGVRHMLLVPGNSSPACLLDRSLSFFPLGEQPSRLLREMYSQHGHTLLDAELVRNQQSMQPVLMLFDVLMFDGVNVARLPLAGRLDYIRRVVEAYRQIPAESLPFVIIGKSFFPREQLGALFGHVRELPADEESGESKHLFEDYRRCHFTDGIIFSHNEPYSPGANQFLLKWKYPSCWTVDFTIRENFRMACNGGAAGLVELKDSSLSQDDRDRLLAEAGGTRDPVAELAYNTARGQWTFCGLRTDKPTPNHVSVVFDTLEVLAENVPRAELIYRAMARTPADDHWDELYSSGTEKLFHQILQDQFARQQHPHAALPQQPPQKRRHEEGAAAAAVTPRATAAPVIASDIPAFPFPLAPGKGAVCASDIPEFPFPQ